MKAKKKTCLLWYKNLLKRILTIREQDNDNKISRRRSVVKTDKTNKQCQVSFTYDSQSECIFIAVDCINVILNCNIGANGSCK